MVLNPLFRWRSEDGSFYVAVVRDIDGYRVLVSQDGVTWRDAGEQ